MHMSCVQWISEVMHFCAGLPIILVGCKKDLRRDPRVIEELRKTNQRPVTPEEVCRPLTQSSRSGLRVAGGFKSPPTCLRSSAPGWLSVYV